MLLLLPALLLLLLLLLLLQSHTVLVLQPLDLNIIIINTQVGLASCRVTASDDRDTLRHGHLTSLQASLNMLTILYPSYAAAAATAAAAAAAGTAAAAA
jgi:hypothetical protein